MPCIKAPPFPPPPPLPQGVSIPVFTPPAPPGVQTCCAIKLPTFPVPAVAVPIAFPKEAITALNGYIKAAKAYYDALGVSCPKE